MASAEARSRRDAEVAVRSRHGEDVTVDFGSYEYRGVTVHTTTTAPAGDAHRGLPWMPDGPMVSEHAISGDCLVVTELGGPDSTKRLLDLASPELERMSLREGTLLLARSNLRELARAAPRGPDERVLEQVPERLTIEIAKRAGSLQLDFTLE